MHLTYMFCLPTSATAFRAGLSWLQRVREACRSQRSPRRSSRWEIPGRTWIHNWVNFGEYMGNISGIDGRSLWWEYMGNIMVILDIYVQYGNIPFGDVRIAE